MNEEETKSPTLGEIDVVESIDRAIEFFSTMDDHLEAVVTAYRDLTGFSDKLADAMGANRERVLAAVMPSNKEGRRNTQRIKTWFEDNREAAEKRMEAALNEQKREAVLAKLSPEDRAALGL